MTSNAAESCLNPLCLEVESRSSHKVRQVGQSSQSVDPVQLSPGPSVRLVGRVSQPSQSSRVQVESVSQSNQLVQSV